MRGAARAQTQMRARAHARTHIQTHVRTHARTHAHTRQRDVRGALEESLRRLQLTYVDLYLVHWPIAQKKGAHIYIHIYIYNHELIIYI